MRKELFYLQLFFFLIHFYQICYSFYLKSHELFYELFFQVDKCVSLYISPLFFLILSPYFFSSTGYTPSITKKLYNLPSGLSRYFPQKPTFSLFKTDLFLFLNELLSDFIYLYQLKNEVENSFFSAKKVFFYKGGLFFLTPVFFFSRKKYLLEFACLLCYH